MENKDVLQKIASLADNKTALAILATHKNMNNDNYYSLIFGERYPDLIQYRHKNESLKHLYLRMLEVIGLLEEELNIKYEKGDPKQILLGKFGWKLNKLLEESSEKGSLKLLKYAIRIGADPHSEYILNKASIYGHLDMVKYLVENHIVDEQINRSLVNASERGQLEIVKYLVEHGADVNSYYGEALNSSTYYGHLEVVKYLIEHGAIVNESALKMALLNGRPTIIQYLQDNMKKYNF